MLSRREHSAWSWVDAKLIALCYLLAAGPLPAQEQAFPSTAGFTLHTARGFYDQATVVNLNDDGWTFAFADSDQGKRQEDDPQEQHPARGDVSQLFPASELVRWGSWSGVVGRQAVWLADGSWLCGELAMQVDGNLKIDSDWLATPPLPSDRIRGLVWHPPASLARWVELQQQMLAATGESDTVWLRSGSRLSGVIHWDAMRSSINTSSSVDTTEQPSELALRVKDQDVRLPMDDVRAIVVSPTLLGRLPQDGEETRLGLEDGTLLRLRQLDTNDKILRMQLLDGLELTSHDPTEELVSSVRYIEHTELPQTRFLSRLEPASYRHLSSSMLNWSLGRDRDVLQRPLMTEQGMIKRGLAMHSASQVAFRWNGEPGRFRAEVLFAKPPPGGRPDLGSVHVRMLLARDGQLEPVTDFALRRTPASTSTTNAASAHQLVDVDVTLAQLVVLVVEESDLGQIGDHVLWLNARIDAP